MRGIGAALALMLVMGFFAMFIIQMDVVRTDIVAAGDANVDRFAQLIPLFLTVMGSFIFLVWLVRAIRG